MVLNKKAISPVVATALLLVVAVVAVVGFQSWFQSYSSGLQADVQERSANTEGVGIELLQLNGTTNVLVYLKNSGTSPLTVDVKVGNCTETGVVVAASAVTTTAVESGTCTLTAGTAAEVVVIAPSGVFKETEIVS